MGISFCEYADVNKLDYSLVQAVIDRNPVALAQALAAGADPSAEDSDALTRACEIGDMALVAPILAAGADPDSGDGTHGPKGGPLMFAADKGHLDVVAALINAGADISVANYGAIEIALRHSNPDAARQMFEALIDGPFSIDAAVTLAELTGNIPLIERVQALRQTGADPVPEMP